MTSMPTPSIADTRHAQMFPTLQPFEIERVRRFGEVRSFPTHQALMTRGQVAFGFIVAGKIAVTKQLRRTER